MPDEKVPQFEGPLNNPDISDEANRELDKAMDRLPATAARRLVPEFAELEEVEESPEQAAPADQGEPRGTKKSSKPKPTRRGLSAMGRLNADEPPPHIRDARRDRF